MAPNVQQMEFRGLLRRARARTFLMYTFVLMICLLLAGGMNSQALAQASSPSSVPQKELVQYIRDAKKAGQNDFQIQQNAVNSGWPQAAVNEAIAYVKSADKDAAPPPSKPAVEKETAT